MKAIKSINKSIILFGKTIFSMIFNPNTDPKVILTRAGYAILILDIFYLIIAFLEISGVTTGTGKIFKFNAPTGEDLKTHIQFLEFINLTIFGIIGGNSIAIIFVILACIRTGTNPIEAIKAINGTKLESSEEIQG
ncbi:MAG: hypothetical protein KDK54_19630 [Leptospiraceae bacterium]|nr:hypothetical protein [Leptospiraceae bacterium]